MTVASVPKSVNNRLRLQAEGGYFFLFAIVEVFIQQVGKSDKYADNH